MPIRVSAQTNSALRATILAIKTLDRDLKKELRGRVRTVGLVEWRGALAREASTTLERRVLVDTARINVSDQNVRIRSAAGKRRVTSGGLSPVEYGRAVEFGANRQKVTTYRSSRGSTRFPVTRHTARQMRPRKRSGYVFFPAAAEMTPRLLALWVQTTVRTIAEALEAGGKA